MLIEETYINDIEFDDSQAAKMALADSVIEAFTPYFSGEIERKKQKLRDCAQDLTELKNVIKESQKNQIDLKLGIVREEKKSAILEDIQVLSNHNVLFGKNKDLAKKIYLRLNELSDVELDKSALLLSKLVRQSIKQVIP